MQEKSVVVFSGGQDSTTVLGRVLVRLGHEVWPIAFVYGQKHAVEINQANRIIEALQARGLPVHDLKIVDIRAFGALVESATALVGEGDVSQSSKLNPNLPASFVPNRNAMFLTMAHAYAQVVGASHVWTGVCETDYSGYPDCRAVFIDYLETALNTGYQTDIKIGTPLMRKSKAETFAMAEEDGILDLVIEESHTCYNGVRNFETITDRDRSDFGQTHSDRHEWGHGCGICPACLLRQQGYFKFVNDKRKAQA